MLLTTRQLLGVLEQGIPLTQLNNFIQQKSEVYEGEHDEVTNALERALEANYMDFINYARVNTVIYNLG